MEKPFKTDIERFIDLQVSKTEEIRCLVLIMNRQQHELEVLRGRVERLERLTDEAYREDSNWGFGTLKGS